MKRDARFKLNFNYHDVNEANLINYSETNLFEYSFELVFKDQLNREIKNISKNRIHYMVKQWIIEF